MLHTKIYDVQKYDKVDFSFIFENSLINVFVVKNDGTK